MERGFMDMMMEAPSVEYDSRKGITVNELNEMFVGLSNYKPRKPEYILSRNEAENLPLWQLKWLGENYIVLTSLEVATIVKERELSSNSG